MSAAARPLRPGRAPAPTARTADPPHRRLFALATALWLAAALAWAVTLAAAALGRPAAAAALPPGLAHGLAMTLGALPLYFAGFLATALPRWQQAPALDAATLRAPAWSVVGGWALWWPASRWSAGAAALALLPVVAGQALLLVRLAADGRAARRGHGPHARLALLGCAACTLLTAAAAAALASQAWALLAALNRAALWAAVAPVFAVAAQRLSPWLGARTLRAVLAALLAQGGLAAADAAGWPLPAVLHGAAALALAATALATAWGLRPGALPRGQRAPMLRMLRAASAWLAAALALAAAAQACRAAAPGTRPLVDALGLAATHALALGFAGGHWLAMVSRVTAVQAGQAQAHGPATWRLHLALQGLTAARVALALAAVTPLDLGTPLALVAAGWAALLLAWTGHHARWLRRRPAPPRPALHAASSPPTPTGNAP